jgi:hypothetical protein
MVAVDRSFPSGSPVCDYWLSRCEGFTVRAGSRNLGVVEQLGFAAAGRVQTLVVRKRHRRRRAIETGQVLAVVPARQILLARRASHVVPAARAVAGGGRRAGRVTARSAAVATPVVVAAAKAIAALLWATASMVWAFAGRAAVELRLATARLVRAAGDEIRDRKRERDLQRHEQGERGKQHQQRVTDRRLLALRARGLQRLEELARRLPRGRQWPAVLGAHEVWGTELEHPRSVANEKVLALGHDRVEVGGEQEPPAPVEQP